MIWALSVAGGLLAVGIFVAFSRPRPDDATREEFEAAMSLDRGERLVALRDLLHRGLNDRKLRDLMADTAIEMLDRSRAEAERDREVTQRIRMPRMPS